MTDAAQQQSLKSDDINTLVSEQPHDALLEHWQSLTFEQRLAAVQKAMNLPDDMVERLRADYEANLRNR